MPAKARAASGDVNEGEALNESSAAGTKAERGRWGLFFDQRLRRTEPEDTIPYHGEPKETDLPQCRFFRDNHRKSEAITPHNCVLF